MGSNFWAEQFANLPYLIFALLVAFTVHEFSHAYIAYRFGDSTAKNAGRLTLNPLVHLDLLGTLMIFLAGFGWAKPVPVNRFHFRNRKWAGVLVSVAGPLSNLLVAIIATGIWIALYKYDLYSSISYEVGLRIDQLFSVLINLNIILFIFNLLPFPPLDGYRIIEDLAPYHIRPKLVQWEQYGVFIFLLLAITPLGDYIFDPIFGILQPLITISIQDLFIGLFNTN